MKAFIIRKDKKSWFRFIFECMVWVLYTGIYKYSYYLEQLMVTKDSKTNFPHLQVLLYAFLLTLYIIPFYRWLIPYFLKNKKYGWFIFLALLFLWVVPKISNLFITYLFLYANSGNVLNDFYTEQYSTFYNQATHLLGWDLRILFTDCVAFSLVAAMHFSFENEQRKQLLERDNLLLQLESLKAQLNPHFLFNTLNSIYGMSLAGSKETPKFILRLSDMMRYILYDCRQSKVPVEKDVEFLQNYFEMEKKRYPNANINLIINGHTETSLIAPLLLIPFAENSFKHGTHRLNDKGFVKCILVESNKELLFEIENDILSIVAQNEQYGGVGIDNVKKRLALYYPNQHELKISNNSNSYKVVLKISLK